MPDEKHANTLKPLKWLRSQLDVGGDFMQEWKGLDKKDKNELREAAVIEMTALGVTE